MIARLRPVIGMGEWLALLGPAPVDSVQRYERGFAELMEQGHAVAFPYGRTGLAFLLEALGIRGMEVICPAYTCVVVAHAIVQSGNEPVFVDCSEGDYNMDLNLAEGAIGDRTGAVVATSIFGYPVDLDRLDDVTRRHPKIPVIQDCAHSFAATWKGRPVQRAGQASIFGSNISKLITSIFGGMVTTDDEVIANRLRALRAERCLRPSMFKGMRRRVYLAAANVALSPVLYGMTHALERRGVLGGLVDYYDEGSIEMPSDFLDGTTPIEGRIGCAQVAAYPRIVAHRRKTADFYRERLAGIDGLVPPPVIEGATYSHCVFRVGSEKREALLAFARARGVQLGTVIDYCVPSMRAYRERLGARFEYTRAEQFASEVVNLPLWVDEGNAVRVAAAVRAFFTKQ
jgi:dTDP-4-amino-4,6-dideoxygalactose transaminase